MDALLPRNSVIDTMIGDEVMAFFIPARGADYRRTAALAAHELVQAVGYGGRTEPWLKLGIRSPRRPGLRRQGRAWAGSTTSRLWATP